ncbi:MAG: PQQ-binding-like beta-propeller repeat protein [Kiritimatiellia bacterium]|nr:PQQ-binding-like beta-propeller repeat protein [Kiritimatiellia bacterium]
MKSVLCAILFTSACATFAAEKPNIAAHIPKADRAQELKDLLKESGVQGGLVVHLGCGDGKLTSTLRVNDRYLVQGLDRNPMNVAVARKNIQARGLYGSVSVDVWEGKTLPYTDNLVNLIIAEDLASVTKNEIQRVLAAHGVALIKTADAWNKIVKPWPNEMGEWTHYLQGPGNNPVTPDTLVGPPRSLQWRCEPLWVRSHAFTTSFTAMVTAQGRIFYILDDAPTGIAQDAVPEQWTLVARDAFNGILLWKKPLSPWGVKAWKETALRYSPKAGEECLVAYKDRVMMTLGYQSAVSILDAATGRTLGVCEGTDGIEEMRCENDILVVNKAGKSLMAFDARDAQPLWKIDASIAHLMINSERVMYYDRKTKVLVCLRLEDGTPLWKNTDLRPRTLMTHGDYVVQGPNLQVLSVETGKVLWSKKTKERISRGMFISQGQIWTMSQNNKYVFSFDLATGEKRTEINTTDFYSAGHHPRCHPVKASQNYLITANRGSEFFSLTGGEHSNNDWVRGACKYGIMPGNGMLYAPPDPCFCFPNQSVKGLNALAPAAKIPLTVVSPESRLQRGPAYKDASAAVEQGPDSDWPMYRYNHKRSGATSGNVTSQLAQHWQVTLRGPLAPPVSGGGKVYVAAKDEHTVYALDSVSGREVWRYTAGGRIDSPPVIDGSRILFGCADGYAYCLRAKDGALVWRFQAAPTRRLICDKGQLESPWRVHGSMLLLDGVVYLTAGRSSFLDGGIWIFGLDAGTGAIRYQTHLDTTMKRRDDVKGKPFMPAHHIEGTQSDLLVSQDGSIYLGQFRFDKRLVRQEVPYLKPAAPKVPDEFLKENLKPGREPEPAKKAKKSPLKKYFSVSGAYMAMTHPGMLEKYLEDFGGMTWGEQRVGLHLMATHGFLENDSFNRAFWSYSDIRLGFNMNLFNRDARCGELMVVTPERTFLVRGHPVPARTKTLKPGAEGYLLAAMSNPGPTTGEDALVPLQVDKRALSKKLSEISPIWSHQVPVRIRSMVLAGEILFVCGVPDIADPDNPLVAQAALEGRKGAKLQAYSAIDGKKLAEYQLKSPAVFDGLIAAGGQLFFSTTDGTVICMGAKNDAQPN